MTPPTEPRHPIGVVAERTGLSPDVLRVWERRYGVVTPKRSQGGQRIYSDADIERLLLLHRATRGGHGISHVASLSGETLADLVREVESSGLLPPVQLSSGSPNPAVEEAIARTRDMDPAGLETLLRRNVARYGIVAFLDAIAAPFLRRVGDAWHEGTLTVSQEHLATAVVQRVVGETAPLLTGGEDRPLIVIATLEGERHASGALMAASIAASEGWRVIYLGADLPAGEIAETAIRTKARAVGISIVADRKPGIAAELRRIEEAVDDGIAIFVGGAGSAALKGSKGLSRAIFVDSMSELSRELAEIGSLAI
ncbi:MAG: MerR family transcriptional regulator [Gemmatimonadaceae bacterium]